MVLNELLQFQILITALGNIEYYQKKQINLLIGTSPMNGMCQQSALDFG